MAFLTACEAFFCSARRSSARRTASRRAVSAGQPAPDVTVSYDVANRTLVVSVANAAAVPCTFTVQANEYVDRTPAVVSVAGRSHSVVHRSLEATAGWYDFTVRVNGQADYSRRFAGRMESGRAWVTDPAMQGTAVGEQLQVAAPRV